MSAWRRARRKKNWLSAESTDAVVNCVCRRPPMVIRAARAEIWTCEVPAVGSAISNALKIRNAAAPWLRILHSSGVG
jgi:hypothetical protein